MSGGGYGQNSLAGAPLANQSQGAYSQALGGAQAAQGMASDPNKLQLATTDLQPYMNPYQKSVTDATIGELDRQEAMQGKAIAGQAQDQGAFGGDRFAIQNAANNRDYDVTRFKALADLNQNNYNQGVQGAQFDINNRMNAGQFGNQQLGGLSQQGFDYGQQLQRNQMQSGQLQQGQVQSLMDLANRQFAGYTGQPQTGLATILQSLQGTYDPKTGESKSKTSPGIGGIMGGVGSMLAK